MTTPLTERHQGSADILLGMAADNHFIYRASMYRIGNDQTRLKEPGVCDGVLRRRSQMRTTNENAISLVTKTLLSNITHNDVSLYWIFVPFSFHY
jgi:hypothetical protein